MHQAFSTTVPIRWGDQDIYGHVNNARLVVLIEEARISWLNHMTRRDGVHEFSGPRVVASLHVDYKKPVMYGTDLEMELWIGRIGTSSYQLQYRAAQGTETVFTASTVMVPLEKPGGCTRPLTKAERDYLSPYLAQ